MKLIFDERLYTVDELSELWGVSRRKLVSFIKEGKLTPIDMHPIKGTTYKISQTEVDRFKEKKLIDFDIK